MKQKLKRLFESNTEENMVHITSDNQCFWKRNHAEAHASGLANKSIRAVSRMEAMADETSDEKLERISKRKAELADLKAQIDAEISDLESSEAALKPKGKKGGAAAPPADPDAETEEQEEEEAEQTEETEDTTSKAAAGKKAASKTAAAKGGTSKAAAAKGGNGKTKNGK